jgi:hypothetical protein
VDEPPIDRPTVVGVEGEAASYTLVVDTLRALRDATPGVIRHASLHGLSGVDRRRTQVPEPALQLRQTMYELIRAGWKLHRLVTVHSEDDLDREIEIAEDLAALGRSRVHATVGGVGGHAAAITVDDRFVALGLDDPHSSYVYRALVIHEPSAVAFWAEHFAQVFEDRRHTFVIASPAGLDRGGISELRRRVRGLSRLMGDVPELVELSDRQREIIEHLGRSPRPQMQEIAASLFISRDAVKAHCEQLYDKFAIPPGRDRLGPLVAELRRRGLV